VSACYGCARDGVTDQTLTAGRYPSACWRSHHLVPGRRQQYIAGWGSHVSGNFKPLYGEPFASMPTDNGQLLVFGL
jgi:hypothetical protein